MGQFLDAREGLMIEIEKRNSGEILVYGHRGAGFSAPENTLASFKLAYEMGVDTIELDIHQAKDGALVVMHDHKVERTTNGTGAVANMTLAEIKKLDAGVKFDEKYQGEQVPTLMEVLDWAKDRIQLLIEIKGYPQPADGIEEELLRQIVDANMVNQVLIKSFFHDSVRQIRALSAEGSTGILYASSLSNPVAIAQAVGANSLRNLHCYWTENAVIAARKAGLQVSAWGVNDKSALERVVSLGLDSFGTDRISMALTFLRERSLR
jgi:glycerophosphoryl diester phosphodiesterase